MRHCELAAQHCTHRASVRKGANICTLSLRRIYNNAIKCSLVNSFKKIWKHGVHLLPLLTHHRILFIAGSVCTLLFFGCFFFWMGLLSIRLNWKQVRRKDLITFAAHYPVTVCTYLPLCVLINQAQTTLSAPLHFSTWLATSNSRARQRDGTTCCCLLFQHLQSKRS